jgi:hypothetical protein
VTYPQQPPGGQNPYGQPGPGYGNPYPPYPGGYGGGFGPPPPPPKKTGVVVAVVAVAVLVLGGLGITGFVAPGFFLSSDDDTTTEAGSTSAESEDSDPTAIDDPVEEPTVATDVPTPTEGGTPSADGKPVDQGAVDAMESFLDSINAGDAADAKNHLCTDSISTAADVDELVGYQPELAIDPTMEGIATGDRSVQVYLQGTAKGQELDGYSTNLWVTSYDGPWCVHAFRAVVI